MDFAKDELSQVGALAKRFGHRLTTHPGQFVQIGAVDDGIFENSVKDLQMHADFLNLMGMDNNSILCVHLGGMYGDKEKTKDRWVSNFGRLSGGIKARLAIENCEKGYSVQDCLEVSRKVKEKYGCELPVIYDSHHWRCYNILHKEPDNSILSLLEEVVKSWGDRIPLFHISEQDPNKQIGAHSEYIEEIPEEIFGIVEKTETRLDIEVEAKGKELAVLKLMDKYMFF
jgi:UV DNA damage endonuclease